MTIELNLRFPDAEHIIVRLGPDDDGSGQLQFTNPVTEKDLRDLQWYVETYGARSLGDPDDSEAKRIREQLPIWGKTLFDAVFKEREAQRRLNSFQDAEEENRLLTISAEHPVILALPWELLHDSASGGGFLFMETPRVSIRRRVAGATGGRRPFKAVAKDSLHLLFVVSRPDDAGFLDPRADSLPVLDAIEEHAPGRVTWEFLRPATLDALLDRLEDKAKPSVDILHFDGHGVFDREGGLPERAADKKGSILLQLLTGIPLKDSKAKSPAESPANTGYLLFEKRDGKPDFVSAEKLGANLHRHKVSLVILSACQSAAIEEGNKGASTTAETKAEAADKRPMGSVAARLTATGIPSVLAMTHSVLVHTTRALFGEFYKELARNKGIGESLDNARRFLFNHPEKYEVQRGKKRVWLKLHDWFLPALYQQGSDTPLLKEPDSASPATYQEPLTNLPAAPEAGFFGRRRELWQIERWFADKTRRITITGFGGQGKTALALEAGRWLTRAGLFRAAVMLRYNQIPSADAVGVAVSNIGSVLGETLIDADAATEALKKTPTLVILDNLEALAHESLKALLDAAVAWSKAGGSRVLCTTRRPDFGHAAYKIEGTNIHRRIQLDALGSKKSPDDALEWCAALMTLGDPPTVPTPKREALIELFDRVKFHPLSIRVLAQQLKTRRPAEVGGRLEQLLSAPAAGAAPAAVPDEDTPAGLLASLQLSLDRLDETARKVLPRLGVFQGGAMERYLLVITGLGDPYEDQRKQLQDQLAAAEDGHVRLEDGKEVPPEMLDQLKSKLREQLAQIPAPSGEANVWPTLRRQLEAAALIEAEDIPGVAVPFLRFHPTLAPMLWAQLDPEERTRLSAAHRARYYALSRYLYNEDTRNPHQARAIAWRELPNLLHAVHAALDAGDPDAVDFADSVNRFLGFFGLKQEAEELIAKAQGAAGEVGSRAWYLAQSNRGQQLLQEGQVAEAAKVFQAILKELGDSPTFNRAKFLVDLGRCFRAGGRPDLAARSAADAIAVCEQLDQDDEVKRKRAVCLTDLANALVEQGKYGEARKAYEGSLNLKREIGRDKRGEGVVLGQLGTLAMVEGKLSEAADRYRAALALFQQLREPTSEAILWHQLGRVFEEARQWDEAERHYREAARIKEENGMISGPNGATTTWHQLAIVSMMAGKAEAAELWYRRAVEGFRAGQERGSTSKALGNLATLLQGQPGRLAEARQLAKEALAIKKALDPGAAEIWKTYSILADIARKEAEAATDARRKAELQAEAREHRRLAREAKRNYPGTRHELRRLAPVILATVATCAGKPEARQAMQQMQETLAGAGPEGQALCRVLDRILAGERDETPLCDQLGPQASMIVETILQGLADPSTLADLLPEEGNEEAERPLD